MREQAIIDHLGRDAFFEKTHPEKPCRVPQFTLEQAILGRPIEVEAYDPVPEAVPDPHEFIREVPLLAAALVTRLKGKLDYSAESLEVVDDFILRRSYRRPTPWTTAAGRRLIQELMAYYGEVLRRNLGGRWGVVKGSGEALHPAITFTIQGQQHVEYPCVRVDEFWEERERSDGLAIHYYLLQSGEWGRLEQHLSTLQ